MENLISESEANQQTEQTMVNINEDDAIMRGENPAEYRTRLLRTIQSGDISSMDHHDRVHGALAYIDSIRDQYEGSARNIHLVVAARGDKRGKIGYKVHGIGGSGKELITTPLAMGASHGKKEETAIKNVYGLQVSSYPNLKREHTEMLRRLMDFKGLREMFEPLQQLITEAKKSKKPYKGFKKGKNHPEGGLSRAEARRQGIHAGIETKDEAKRKGGFGKLSKKTQKRRKSFCARMCGMKRRRTSSKTANDPKSKINAALRVWGCRCDTNESYESKIDLLIEAKKKSLKTACWKGYEAIGMKKKNGKSVPNCVPTQESTLNNIQQKVKEKFLVEDCGCGKGKPKPKPKPVTKPKQNIAEEVVNSGNKDTMTDKEIKSRDKIAKKLTGVRVVKKGDTPKNAKYRLATYIELLKRKGSKKNKRVKG